MVGSPYAFWHEGVRHSEDASASVTITVEAANMLTRSLVIFGQRAVVRRLRTSEGFTDAR
jgi:hypothetical protein